MTNHLGIGVNGSKHICGGAEGEEARRDRQLSGTSVKSPKPYLMPDQNMATANSRGGSRAVRFDYVPQPVGEGHKQNYPKEAHYLAFVGERGRHIFERIRVAEKLKLSPLPKQGGYMDKLKLMLIDWLCKDDPKKVIRLILKRHLEGYHVASNPIRKSKRTHGDAII